ACEYLRRPLFRVIANELPDRLENARVGRAKLRLQERIGNALNAGNMKASGLKKSAEEIAASQIGGRTYQQLERMGEKKTKQTYCARGPVFRSHVVNQRKCHIFAERSLSCCDDESKVKRISIGENRLSESCGTIGIGCIARKNTLRGEKRMCLPSLGMRADE